MIRIPGSPALVGLRENEIVVIIMGSYKDLDNTTETRNLLQGYGYEKE